MAENIYLVEIKEKAESVISYTVEIKAKSKKQAIEKVSGEVKKGTVFIKNNYIEESVLDTLTEPEFFLANEDDFSEKDMKAVRTDRGWTFETPDHLASVLRMGRSFTVQLEDGSQSMKVYYDDNELNSYRIGDCAILNIWDFCDGSTIWKEVKGEDNENS